MLGALAAPPDASLVALLGEVAARIVGDELLAGARRWAAAVAPGRAYEANVASACLTALAGHAGPVLLVAPDVPGLTRGMAEHALSDLDDGAEWVIGAAFDGTPYFVGLPRLDAELLDLIGAPRDELFARVGTDGGGMVFPQRRLVSASDARAFAADPLLGEELALPLAAGLDVRARRDRLDGG